MDTSELTLRFQGVADLRPSVLRAKELGEVITAFEEAVAEIVRVYEPDIKKELIAVPLVSVDEGSVLLAFHPNLTNYTYRAAIELAEAVSQNQFRNLPLAAFAPLRTLTRFVKRYGCNAEIGVRVNGEVKATATITPATRIETLLQIDGETILYGEVKRVGGIEPHVVLRTIQGDTLYCDTTEEIAKHLGTLLYQQVSVYGKATWDYDTQEIKQFEIHHVLLFNNTPFTETLETLHEVIGEYVDEIENVDEWVETLREGEDLRNGDSVR